MPNFDLFRITKSKEAVDICSNTLREYIKAGLPRYEEGVAVFVSKRELEQFIRREGMFKNRPPVPKPTKE